MPFYGDLRTFSLEELLRWAATSRKTGVLAVERNGISRRVEFRSGWVGSCSSNDPASRLGQFLLSRGRVDETQLQHLLALQRQTGKRLGLLLVEMKVLTRAELAAEVALKAEETIHGLFDWDDAFFRFDSGATLDPDQIEVSLAPEDLIERGRKHKETLQRIRGVFRSSGVVLERTERDVPLEMLERPLVRRVLESIDGQRSLAEILLHTRSSQFLVLQFLFRLQQREVLRIKEVRPSRSLTLLDAAPRLAIPVDGRVPERADTPGGGDARPGSKAPPLQGVMDRIETATHLIEREEYEAAVELLRDGGGLPADDYERRLLHRAEGELVRQLKRDESIATMVPVLLRDRHELLDGEPSAEARFLLSMIDGQTDVQSLLWLTPLREVDVLIALRRMSGKGFIELAQAVRATASR